MTLIVPASGVSPARPSAPATAEACVGIWPDWLKSWLCLVLALAIILIMLSPRLMTVWTTGGYFDTDDAMRMVQVRDLLAGQGWYDLVAHRFAPPQGVLSHWSRVVDVPLVLLLKGFGLFLAPESAERATRIVFPTLLLVGLFAASSYAARVLLGPGKAFMGVIAVAACGVAAWQFVPGRVDHHGPQLILVVFALANLAHSFDPAHARRAAWSGIAIALSLAIGVENLPFIVVLAAAPPLAFVLTGERAAKLLVAFAMGLGLSLPLVFVATVPPERWLDPARDALSIIHLVGGLGGAAGCILLSRLRLERPAARLVACSLVGLLAVGPLFWLWPHLLRDPYEAVDPELRVFWMDRVSECEPLFAHLRREPLDGWSWLLAYVFGFAGAVFAASRADGVERGRWLLLVATLVIGFLAACWQIRVTSTTAPLVALGTLGLVVPLRASLMRRHAAFAGPLTLVALILMLSQQGVLGLMSLSQLGQASPTGSRPAAAGASKPGTTSARPKVGCRDASSFAPLAALPRGLAIAQIDPGSYILAHTPHSVVAAAYHRDNSGNLLSLHVFTASPEVAEPLVRASGARWLFLCLADDGDLRDLTALAQDGLAARLAANRPPSWLKPAPLADTPYLAFEVVTR